MKKNKKIKNIVNKVESVVVIKAVAILVVGIFILLIGWTYVFSSSTLSNKVFTNLPLPALVIEKNNIISTKEIAENLASIRMFYEKQDFSKVKMRVDFNTEDGKKRLKLREKELINKLIEDRAIEILAKRNGITVTSKMVANNVDRKLNEYRNEEFIEKSLKELYGWSLGDFKKKVVKPNLYKDKLEEWMNNNINQEERRDNKNKIIEAKKEIDEGVEFSEVANKYSSGPMAKSGGAMGWFKKDYLARGIREGIENLNVGEISGILESKVGFHIVKLENKKDINEETLYSVSQVFLPKLTFASWLEAEIKKMKVLLFMKDYKWNGQTGFVEFNNKSMREFEEKVLSSPIDDPSLLGI